ncbi:hypothetical protein KSP39_PZI008618 [Platanthera zijinensis]|uniref:CSC1/OSCA1-like N-terminal transmembrane domain-containing protein n=1 Tax=Platanthera zijinensis TaxID=2320716 RepID=A0AAP0G863_9ASPA
MAVSAVINILSVIVFLIAFAVMRVQSINSRVYYPKPYINGSRSPHQGSSNGVLRFVKFNNLSYVVTFLSWVPEALQMSQTETRPRFRHLSLDLHSWV